MPAVSARHRQGLVYTVAIIRHQRERQSAVTPVANDAKPGPLKLAILAARAKAKLPLFPER